VNTKLRKTNPFCWWQTGIAGFSCEAQKTGIAGLISQRGGEDYFV
jgi:hypothetical protein